MEEKKELLDQDERVVEIELERSDLLRTIHLRFGWIRNDLPSASVEKYGIINPDDSHGDRFQMVFMRLSPDTEERQLLKSLVIGRYR